MSDGSLKETLFKEKSLSALLKVYEGSFPAPLPAKALGGWCGMLTFICLLALWSFIGLDGFDFQKAMSLMVSYALTVCSALMGVVIAGMSIFAASLKPKVVNGLIETEYPSSGTSSLKFIFAMFSYLLYSLFVVIVTCGVYYIFLDESSIFLQFSHAVYQGEVSEDLKAFIFSSYTSFLIGLLVFLASILKSFIWNLHQVLLVVAVFNGHADSEV